MPPLSAWARASAGRFFRQIPCFSAAETRGGRALSTRPNWPAAIAMEVAVAQSESQVLGAVFFVDVLSPPKSLLSSSFG